MDFAEVRRAARARRSEALGGAELASGHDVDRLLQRAQELHRLGIKTIGPDDVYSDVAGLLHRRGRLISVSHRLPADERRAVIAHELGHFHLHPDPLLQLTRLNFTVADRGVQGYSEDELKEVQADVFAAEFLCPTQELREALVTSGRNPRRIATDLGLPYGLVLSQAVEALLDNDDPPPLGPPAPALPALDREQLRAATWTEAHLIVVGPPSSGKTTVAAARIRHLLATGEAPGSIAVFSDSVAAAARLRSGLPEEAGATVQVWSGTLRMFAKEIVRMHPDRIGRSPSFRVLDDVAARSMIEGVGSQGRLVDGARSGSGSPYRTMALLKNAGLEPDGDVAAFAAIVASPDADARGVPERVEWARRTYRDYDLALQRADAIDASDLVRFAGRIVQDSDVRERLQARFRHLVVDDFEETTAAEQRLLAALASPLTRIFALAGPFQSLGRFKGARPEAIASFGSDFRGGGRVELAGRRKCIALDAASMDHLASGRFRSRERRGACGPPPLTVSVVRDAAAEVLQVARRIDEWRSDGIPYQDQVVVARRHSHVGTLAQGLAAVGIPVRHAGEYAEREEVRDLLALATIGSDRSGAALSRIAQLDIYGASARDAARLSGLARFRRETVFRTLGRISGLRGLSRSALRAFERLRRDLDGIDERSDVFVRSATWLFERSRYLDAVIAGDDDGSRRARDAVRQFLGVCEEHVRQGDRNDANLAIRLSRMRSVVQDSHFSRSDHAAADTRAVRVMTIRAAKGLKFRGVHVARLPPPSTAAPGDAAVADPETAAFMTASSRASERLHLSRCLRETAPRDRGLRYPGLADEGGR